MTELRPGLIVWQEYMPEVKVEGHSTAVRTGEGWLVIDPLPVRKEMQTLFQREPLAGIVLTSGNHQRASLEWRRETGAKIYAPRTAQAEVESDIWYDTSVGEIEVISLPGGAKGESALSYRDVLITGDALIHLKDLEILPEKYCEDFNLLKVSLEKLREVSFSILCFAHGDPMVESPKRAVEGLLHRLRES